MAAEAVDAGARPRMTRKCETQGLSSGLGGTSRYHGGSRQASGWTLGMSNTMCPAALERSGGRSSIRRYGFGVTVVVLFTSTVVSVAA